MKEKPVTLSVTGFCLGGLSIRRGAILRHETKKEHIRMEIVRCLLPDIVAYFESEQEQREFEEWRKQNMFNGKSYECIKKEINS